MFLLSLFFFFFSSRRRHTRCLSDWSSDVCSSDLKRLAAVQRKKVNPQKLASQVGRALQRLKAHKYFDYAVDPNGQLQGSRRTEVIQAEKIRDGLYLLGTNATPEQMPSTGVLRR